jgi:hypothetical protein
MKELVVEYGQPSRFVFDLDTVRKWGQSQKVSVDAIENISILGTGSGGIGAVLKSGLNKFFKEYPYSRIGIRCTLQNDNFNIRGKIVEGGTEYLIRRAFLRGIDMVTGTLKNMVSFKDMQERVGRVVPERTGRRGSHDKGERECSRRITMVKSCVISRWVLCWVFAACVTVNI